MEGDKTRLLFFLSFFSFFLSLSLSLSRSLYTYIYIYIYIYIIHIYIYTLCLSLSPIFALGLLAAFVAGQAGYGMLMQHNSI